MMKIIANFGQKGMLWAWKNNEKSLLKFSSKSKAIGLEK